MGYIEHNFQCSSATIALLVAAQENFTGWCVPIEESKITSNVVGRPSNMEKVTWHTESPSFLPTILTSCIHIDLTDKSFSISQESFLTDVDVTLNCVRTPSH